MSKVWKKMRPFHVPVRNCTGFVRAAATRAVRQYFHDTHEASQWSCTDFFWRQHYVYSSLRYSIDFWEHLSSSTRIFICKCENRNKHLQLCSRKRILFSPTVFFTWPSQGRRLVIMRLLRNFPLIIFARRISPLPFTGLNSEMVRSFLFIKAYSAKNGIPYR